MLSENVHGNKMLNTMLGAKVICNEHHVGRQSYFKTP